MKSLLASLKQTWKLFAALTIVVLRSRELRRKLMFIVSLLAMGMAFIGMVLLDGFLTERVWLFLAYWLLCAALVVLMLLLAVYDMARVRVEVSGDAVRKLGEVFRELEKTKRCGDDKAEKKEREHRAKDA